MARNRLPYTYPSRKKLKAGIRTYWRFRRDGIDSPLPGDPQRDIAAMRKYADLMEQAEARTRREEGPAPRSFAWLAKQYLASEEYRALADRTQTDYRRVLDDRLVPALGPERFDCISRAAIKLVRDQVRSEGKSIRTANKVKQVASLLYSWADEEELLPEGFANPGARLKKLKGKGSPIAVWSKEEIDLFLGACDPHMKTAVLVALYTGQRASDVVAMEWKDVLGGVVRVRQKKTGEPLDIPCHPVLKAHLEQIRTRFGGPIVRGPDGRPTNANALASAIYRQCRRIEGMPQRSLHGLRYASAANLEAAGCSVVQISSIVGHRTYQMAMQYARQRRDAEAAMARLEGRNEA